MFAGILETQSCLAIKARTSDASSHTPFLAVA